MPSTRRALTLTFAMTVLPIQVATAQSVQLDPADDSAPDEAPSLQATENRILHLEQQVEALDAMDPQIESLEQSVQSLTSADKTNTGDTESLTHLEALNQRLPALEASARAFIANTESRIEAMAERLGITAIPLDQSAIKAAERVAASAQQDEDTTDASAPDALIQTLEAFCQGALGEVFNAEDTSLRWEADSDIVLIDPAGCCPKAPGTSRDALEGLLMHDVVAHVQGLGGYEADRDESHVNGW